MNPYSFLWNAFHMRIIITPPLECPLLCINLFVIPLECPFHPINHCSPLRDVLLYPSNTYSFLRNVLCHLMNPCPQIILKYSLSFYEPLSLPFECPLSPQKLLDLNLKISLLLGILTLAYMMILYTINRPMYDCDCHIL